MKLFKTHQKFNVRVFDSHHENNFEIFDIAIFGFFSLFHFTKFILWTRSILAALHCLVTYVVWCLEQCFDIKILGHIFFSLLFLSAVWPRLILCPYKDFRTSYFERFSHYQNNCWSIQCKYLRWFWLFSNEINSISNGKYEVL